MGVPPLQGGSNLQGGGVPTLQSSHQGSVPSLQGNVPHMQLSGVKNEVDTANESDGRDGVSWEWRERRGVVSSEKWDKSVLSLHAEALGLTEKLKKVES